MPSELLDRIVEGGWIGQCNRCGAVHGISQTANVNSFGALLRRGVFMGIPRPVWRCAEVSGKSQVQRACPGSVIEMSDQATLISAWRLGGWQAVRSILEERALANKP